MSGFKRKYEFKRFADGMPHVLKHGEHYDTPDLTFCKTAWMWAVRHGYRLQFQRLGGRRCRLQFVPGVRREPGRPPGPPIDIHYPQHAVELREKDSR